MPKSVTITKESIINATVELVRREGADAINARAVARELNVSTQPIFSNFASINDLFIATVERSVEIFREYMQRELESGIYPDYKASGMAYIRFAKEQKELFKLLYMRDRTGEGYTEEESLFSEMEKMVHDSTGLVGDDTTKFHFEMWTLVHGIATMLATNYLTLKEEAISAIITDVYQGLKKQYGLEG